jgi:hypothetical protein
LQQASVVPDAGSGKLGEDGVELLDAQLALENQRVQSRRKEPIK